MEIGGSIFKSWILMTQTKHSALIELFVTLIDKGLYFQAHEALEEIWFPRRFEKAVPEIRLLKGLINQAVSFELFKRGREKQSEKVWNNSLKHIEAIKVLESPFLGRYKEVIVYMKEKKVKLV